MSSVVDMMSAKSPIGPRLWHFFLMRRENTGEITRQRRELTITITGQFSSSLWCRDEINFQPKLFCSTFNGEVIGKLWRISCGEKKIYNPWQLKDAACNKTPQIATFIKKFISGGRTHFYRTQVRSQSTHVSN